MAASTTPRTAERSLRLSRRIAVAVSGGHDSTALWHAVARAARDAGEALQVVALHVHHGLQPQADDWLERLQRQARRWARAGLPVSLQWRRVAGSPGSGESIEAWARRERYAALVEMARDADIGLVLLAHQRQDQAETFLLQALRGAGPAGLAAMPRQIDRGGIVWARPWVDQPREAIDAYLRRHRLRAIDDPSNAQPEYARSRLRLSIWPALRENFEQADACLSASARRAHEATECLRELARADLQQTGSSAESLSLPGWLGLSPARRANALRAWLADRQPRGVAETLVQRLLAELPLATAARWPAGGGELRLYDGVLRLFAQPRSVVPGPSGRIDLSCPGRHAVPEWGGAFEVRAAPAAGLSAVLLAECELRARCGGERFQRQPGSPPRSLKKQYQAMRLPAWQRGGPLVFARGELLYVPGLGIDARACAASAGPALQLRWLPAIAAGPPVEPGGAGSSG
jgi:tRNA(Ile)-lysidine synthase